MSGLEKKFGDKSDVTDIRPFRIVLLERVAANKALRRLFILFWLIGINSLYRPIRPELFAIAGSNSISTIKNSVKLILLIFITVNWLYLLIVELQMLP